jgi:serine/threonine protein phosphatase PrpC
MSQALVESARVANEAVVERTALDSDNAASATFAAAVVSDGLVFYANLGDSRVYWLPDEGEDRQLSVDDSVAQARIEAGIPREEAENGEGAHSITKWLGRDAADVVPRVGVLQPTTEGWVVVCSDGLWNYASLPGQIRDVLDEALAADPQPSSLVDVTERMVAWANGMGGRDNITVALARLGGLAMLAETDAPSVTTPGTAQTPSGTGPAAEAPEVGIPPRPAPATPAPSDATAPYDEGPAPAVPPGPATTPPPGIVVPNPAD